jgi:hypothetical protein
LLSAFSARRRSAASGKRQVGETLLPRSRFFRRIPGDGLMGFFRPEEPPPNCLASVFGPISSSAIGERARLCGVTRPYIGFLFGKPEVDATTGLVTTTGGQTKVTRANQRLDCDKRGSDLVIVGKAQGGLDPARFLVGVPRFTVSMRFRWCGLGRSAKTSRCFTTQAAPRGHPAAVRTHSFLAYEGCWYFSRRSGCTQTCSRSTYSRSRTAVGKSRVLLRRNDVASLSVFGMAMGVGVFSLFSKSLRARWFTITPRPRFDRSCLARILEHHGCHGID